MLSPELKMALDEQPVPVTAAQLEAAVGDTMFFAMDGPSRAYFAIPTGSHEEGAYRIPQVLRIVYSVLAYRKQLRDGEDAAAVESELVACMWDDMKRIRVKMADMYGELDPILFWRKRPTFGESSDGGDRARYAHISLRLAVPGFDFVKHPVLSYIGRDSGDRPFPRPVSPAQKDEILFADEVLKLSIASEQAHNEHHNALQKLITMRSQRVAEEIRGVQPMMPIPGLFGQMKVSGAMRALLDSQAIASRADGVALVSATNPNMPPREDLAYIQEQLKKLDE